MYLSKYLTIHLFIYVFIYLFSYLVMAPIILHNHHNTFEDVIKTSYHNYTLKKPA